MTHILRRVGRVVQESLLTLAALGGAACILLVILAFTGGYTLIMFKTGSMSPTIPAGSVALVREIPASAVQLGNVLTVDRVGNLPVTHRVTSVSAGASSDERVITMQGDANDSPDPLPYTITSGRLVIGSVPHLAHVIVWFGNPWVLGGITVSAALLVTWAFWPRTTPATSSRATTQQHSTPRHGTQATSALAVIALAATTAPALILLALPAPAQAAPPEFLSLTSNLSGPDTRYTLDASTPLEWLVRADTSQAPSNGDLQLTLSGAGDPRLGLVAVVDLCTVPWNSSGCVTGERLLYPEGAVSLDGTELHLVHLATPVTAYLRVRLTATPEVGHEQAEAALTIRATVKDATAVTVLDGTGTLARTGASSLSLTLAPAAVILGLGVACVASRRIRHGAPR